MVVNSQISCIFCTHKKDKKQLVSITFVLNVWVAQCGAELHCMVRGNAAANVNVNHWSRELLVVVSL